MVGDRLVVVVAIVLHVGVVGVGGALVVHFKRWAVVGLHFYIFI